MKKFDALVIFIVGFLMLGTAAYLQLQQENSNFETYLQQHQHSLIVGWNSDWNKFIEQNIDENVDPDPHLLVIDPTTFNLVNTFFPTKSSSFVNWQLFQEQHDLNEKKQFLQEVFQLENTFERAIAIKEWKKLFDEIPKIKLTAYEMTLVDTYTNHAYQTLFEQKNDLFDIKNISSTFQLKITLLKRTKDNDILLYFPSYHYITDTILPAFLRTKGNIPVKVNTSDPFFLIFDDSVNPFRTNNFLYYFFMSVGILCIFIAIILLLYRVKQEKDAIFRRVSFLNQIVHEVKTPLTGIRLNADLLDQYGYDQTLLKTLITSSQRLNELFDDIILINKADHTSENTYMTKEELNDYFQSLLQEFLPHIIVKIEIHKSFSLDKSRCRLIIRNLCKNAIKYGDTAQISIQTLNRTLRISIQDQGPGISASESNSIFKEFYRSEKAKSANPNGLGLGLAIAKKLSLEMNAQLYLQNPGQKGAIFIFELEEKHAS